MSDRLLQAFSWLFANRKAPEWLSIAVADTSPVQPVTFRLNAAAVFHPFMETPALIRALCVRQRRSIVRWQTSESGDRFNRVRVNAPVESVKRDNLGQDHGQVRADRSKTGLLHSVLPFTPKTLLQRIERVAQSSPSSNNPSETVSP